MIDRKAVAVVGLGAVLPDAADARAFWQNIRAGRYSIREVPEGRWNPADYFDSNPSAPDKTYSKIGGWISAYEFAPLQWGIPIPPRVLSVMDESQKTAIAAARQALLDYGYPQRPLDPVRTAVILGNALAGENHYNSTMRIRLPDYLNILAAIPDFQNLPPQVQQNLLDGMTRGIRQRVPEITEDTMPGELSNVIAGRVANVFNFAGPNFVTDAACASSFAALQSSVEGLISHKFDAVLTGGIDRNMGPEGFVKFSKIGALSPDGSRPYADGANGFVMGEGGAVFLLKRLEDAERDGDRIYAVVRGIGSSSDGKGKGITAPNPLGQQRAIERAWQDAALSPATASLFEGHGTSTRVGDVAETSSMAAIFAGLGVPPGSIALGSVKSNIGHLKAAAGAAGMLKMVFALHEQVLPPSVNFDRPNPNIDFAHLPFYVNTQAVPWAQPKAGHPRRAGISSFGFGGTNFHVIVEEYLPGVLTTEKSVFPSVDLARAAAQAPLPAAVPAEQPAAAAVGPQSAEVTARILALVSAQTGYPPEMLDLDLDLEADLGIDTVKQAELFAAVRESYGIPRREDLRLSDYNTLAKVVDFVMQSGQGITTSAAEPVVEPAVLAAAPSSSPDLRLPPRGLYFLSAGSSEALKQQLLEGLELARAGSLPAQRTPSREELSRPERLAIDYESAADLIKKAEKTLRGFESGSPSTWQALTGQGVYRGSGRPGKIAFMFPGQGSQYANMLRELRDLSPLVAATFAEADAVMQPILGRPLTSLIFVEDTPESIAQADAALKDTTITQPAVLTANIAMMRLLGSYGFSPDLVIGHSLGEYGALVAAGVLSFADALRVVSARGREMTKVSMEDNGCMAAVSAPIADVERILRSVDGYVVIANINSPLQSVIGGSTAGVDAALTAFQAAGFQAVKIPVSHAFHTRIVAPAGGPLRSVIAGMEIKPPRIPIVANVTGKLYPSGREEILDMLAAQLASPVQFIQSMQTLYDEGARILVESGPKRVLTALATDNLKDRPEVSILSTNHPRKGALPSLNEALCGLYAAGAVPQLPAATVSLPLEISTAAQAEPAAAVEPADMPEEAALTVVDGRLPLTGSVVISGAGLGLPGRSHPVFDDNNIQRILAGENMIESLPEGVRSLMLDKRVTRLNKNASGATLEVITDMDRTIKLAGQPGEFDLSADFGIPAERVEATDISTQLAVAAGIEALRDAGIPLVMRYRQTSVGSLLPDRWMLPEALADETGVIFGSAFPGLARMAEENERFYEHQNLTRQLDMLRQLQPMARQVPELRSELTGRINELEARLARLDYKFDRRFIFRILNMGHSQFAEIIGARGPNTSVNAACATTTHAVALAEDWIRTGRARRVIVIAGDNVTSGSLAEWIGTGLLASGATTTEGNLRLAALPFDRRRNGMIMGMGAAALVVESEDAVRERGMRGIAEVLSSQISNSAFHGTRLDVSHVREVMDRVVALAEKRFGLSRGEIAARTVFISHETYTPARGGSAAAEIHSLRHVFGETANQVVIANTKGFTGHTMGVGVEDVVAVKVLENQVVPPIANLDDGFEPDPDLGDLNLSRGGAYPVDFALRLGAGFGSQIAMTLLRRIPAVPERRDTPRYQRWLANVAGLDTAETEVVQRTLRIRHDGPPARIPARSTWEYGQGPTLRAEAPTGAPAAALPVPAAIPAAVEPPAIVQQPAARPPAGTEEIKTTVLALVSAQTGYPAEMLDLDLDLEADLGVDTVKQAELFAAVRETYGIPRREDLRLSDYNTLAKVIAFVTESLAAQASAPAGEQPAQAVEPPPAQPEPESRLTRRVPVPVLRPRLELCKPTGITLDESLRVIVVHDQGKAGESLARKLRARRVQVLNLRAVPPEAVEAEVSGWLQDGKIHGVYFLPALDREPQMAAMDAGQWQVENERRTGVLYTLLHALPGDPFLISATRLGGLHAALPGEVPAPLGGAVSGFTKAYAWEHPHTLVKVIDFEAGVGATAVAARLCEETTADPGAVEIGWENDLRYTLSLEEQPLQTAAGSLALDSRSVYLVSGGAGGITAPILLDLARRLGGIFYLTGRSPLPDPTDPDLARLHADREGLKLDLARRMTAAGQKATPARVEQHLAALERSAAALALVDGIRAAGAQAHYLAADVTDLAAVKAVFEQITTAEGKIDVLVHAAGVDQSHPLSAKTRDEFMRVYNTKAAGFYNLISLLSTLPQPPQAVAAFSSIAGRFGNAGQTDYSAANDLLCKLTAALRCTHPHIRFLAIDWGAWAGVGMASRGSVPQVMERAGIEMLPVEEAAPLLRRELLAGSQGEVVLAGALGLLARPRERDGGLDLEKANQALTGGNPSHVMLSRAAGLDLFRGIRLEAELDPTIEPFLKDHALNGIPVLPGVMGIEGFSVAARHVSSVLASAGSGFRVERLEDVRFLAPFKFYRNEPRRITWYAQVVRRAAGLAAEVSLESINATSRLRAGEVMRHFSGRVYLEPLAARPSVLPRVEPPHWNGGRTLDAEDVYRLYFHGPSFQVLDGVQQDGDTVVGRMRTGLPQATAREQGMLAAPLLIELCLQTAGVYEAGATGLLALPSSIGEVRLYPQDGGQEQLFAQVYPRPAGQDRISFDARVIDAEGRLYLELRDYRTSALPYPVETGLVAPMKKLIEDR